MSSTGSSAVKSGFPGTERLARIETRLSSILKFRSADQVRFHKAMMATCLPIIFRESWAEHAKDIARELGRDFDDDFIGIVVRSPRRSGKTTAIAAFCAAMMLECLDLKMVVCAAQTDHLIFKIFAMITEGKPAGASIVRAHNEMTVDMHGSENKVRFESPSTVDARIAEHELIVVDELSSMTESYFRAMDPIIENPSKNGSRTIAITTSLPKDEHALVATAPRSGRGRFELIYSVALAAFETVPGVCPITVEWRC